MSATTVGIHVGTPIAQKGGTLELMHYEYPITWTLADGRQINFNRRYSDFESLRTQLSNKYWYTIVPPIPVKESLAQNVTAKMLPMMSSHADPSSSSGSTLMYRQTYLRHFLRRLADHPELSRDALVTECFIDSAAWERALKNPIPAPVFLSTSLIGGIKAMMSAATTATTKGGKGAASAFDMEEASGAYTKLVQACEAQHPEKIEYSKTTFFVTHLKKTFERLETEMLKLTEKRMAEGEALQEFGRTFCQLSLGEDDASLRQSIELVSAQSQAVATIRAQHAEVEMSLVSALGFLVGTCSAVRETLERMASAEEYRRQLDEKVQSLSAQLSKGVPPANQESLTHELETVAMKRDEQTQMLSMALPHFASDFINFHQTRQSDTQALLRQIGKTEIDAAETMAAQLRKLGVPEGTTPSNTM